MFVQTGNYTEHNNNDLRRSSYYTFTPRPLMGESFYAMSDELAMALTDTHRALGILEGMAYLLSDAEALYDLMLFRESCFSKMIDYPDTDIYTKLIMSARSGPENDVVNIMAAYHYALETSTRKLSFNSIASHAFYGNNSQQKVFERTKQIFLSKSTSSYRQYNPTAPNKIRAAIVDMQKFMGSDSSDVLIRAAMCHYQFEMIHPYESSNGIVGRILVYQILSQAKLHGIRLLSLSEAIILSGLNFS